MPADAYTLVVHMHAKPDCVEKLAAKLQEASQVYSKDKETYGWFVMQSESDPCAFTVVERFANESSQKYHLENPYWQTFNPYVMPLLDREMDLRRSWELDTKSAPVKVETDAEMWKATEKHQTY